MTIILFLSRHGEEFDYRCIRPGFMINLFSKTVRKFRIELSLGVTVVSLTRQSDYFAQDWNRTCGSDGLGEEKLYSRLRFHVLLGVHSANGPEEYSGSVSNLHRCFADQNVRSFSFHVTNTSTRLRRQRDEPDFIDLFVGDKKT